jgi:transposase-like protein
MGGAWSAWIWSALDGMTRADRVVPWSVRPVYTTVNADQAAARLAESAAIWGSMYPAAVPLWRNAWTELVPSLDCDVEIRKIICTTKRDRVPQRPLPTSGPRPGPLPQR